MELTALKGIGDKTAEAFKRLGIFSAEDLICFYPRSYESFDKPKALYELEPGKIQTVEGVLTKDASVNRNDYCKCLSLRHDRQTAAFLVEFAVYKKQSERRHASCIQGQSLREKRQAHHGTA